MVRVPRALDIREREGLKDWAARTISTHRASLAFNPYRTMNMSDMD